MVPALLFCNHITYCDGAQLTWLHTFPIRRKKDSCVYVSVCPKKKYCVSKIFIDIQARKMSHQLRFHTKFRFYETYLFFPAVARRLTLRMDTDEHCMVTEVDMGSSTCIRTIVTLR
jgi:hypothetical protein